jgi:SPP1 family predicted phage head-tail adaptor
MARPPINTGRMRTQVQFLQRTAGQDEAGQPVESWPVYVTKFADVRAPSGVASAQQVAANAETSVTAYSVRVRYCTDLTAGMRAQWGGVLADVAQVIPDHAMRRYTDVVCIVGGVA